MVDRPATSIQPNRGVWVQASVFSDAGLRMWHYWVVLPPTIMVLLSASGQFCSRRTECGGEAGIGELPRVYLRPVPQLLEQIGHQRGIVAMANVFDAVGGHT